VAAGLVARPETEQASQGGEVARLIVDGARVLLENLVALGPCRMLELEDGLGVEQVVLALAPPLPVTARVEVAVRQLARPVRPSGTVASKRLSGYVTQADPLNLGGGPCEIAFGNVTCQPDRFEDLSSGVRGHR
jgi:hypothetical protein